MNELIIGGIVGLLLGSLQQALHRYVVFEAIKLRLVPFSPRRRSAFIRRVRRVLKTGGIVSLRLTLFLPLIPLVVTAAWFFSWQWTVGLALGYLFVSGLESYASPHLARDFGIRVRKLALDRLGRHGLPEEQLEPLELVLGSEHEEVRMRAIRQLGRLGTMEARTLLEKLCQSDNQRTEVAATRALEDLEGVLSGNKLLSASQLPVFIDEAEYWHRQYYARQGKARRDSEEKHHELLGIVEDIIHSQLPLRQAHPHLFCRKCRTRAKWYEQGRYSYVLCRHCGDVLDLETGVKKVVGRIGEFPDLKRVNGEVQLNLWDKSTGKAIFSDLDRLEIEGGGDLNYDWAVSAVVAQLQELAPEEGWKIEVVLRNKPDLDANSKRLLKEIGWQG